MGCINRWSDADHREGIVVDPDGFADAVLDTNEYEIGIKVSDEQLDDVRLRRHRVHPAWNYTISPRERE